MVILIPFALLSRIADTIVEWFPYLDLAKDLIREVKTYINSLPRTYYYTLVDSKYFELR